MPDPTTFDARLADAFERYVAPAPVAVDAPAISHAVATGAAMTRLSAEGWRRGIGGRRSVVLVAAVLVLALAAATLVGGRLLERPAPRTFLGDLESTGRMTVERERPLLAALPDGRVLVFGGGTRFAEMWDAASGAFSSVGMSHPSDVSAALTLDDGRVLVLGRDLPHASIFDPTTGTFRGGVVGGVGIWRTTPAAAPLRDGRVLVVGGVCAHCRSDPADPQPDGRMAELFDPATGRFTPTGDMTVARAQPTAVALKDGRVLVTSDGTAELFDPAAGAFTSTEGWCPEIDATPVDAIRMADGRVLLIGAPRVVVGQSHASAAVYDPATGRCTSAAAVPSLVDGAVALDDGTALLIGVSYENADDRHTFAVIYDPDTGVLRELEGPTAYHPSVVRLPDGRVLVVGGGDKNGPRLDIAQIYR
jgi:hypothetical protein